MKIHLTQTTTVSKTITIDIPGFKGTDADLSALMRRARWNGEWDREFDKQAGYRLDVEYEVTYNSTK